MQTRGRIIGAVAAFVAVLSGCSGGEPASVPSASSSSVASQPPTEPAPSASIPVLVAPTLPPEATTQDAAGAEAFVRHWFNLVNYGYNTGDTGPLKAASSSVCLECDRYVTRIHDMTGLGSRIEGDAINVSEVLGGVPDASGRAPVEVTYGQAALTLVDEQGARSDFPANAPEMTIAYVDIRPGTWTMIGLALP